MSNTYEEWRHTAATSWIIFPGQLVRVKANCFEQSGLYGIIIECMYPDFGYSGNDKYLVLIDGSLKSIESFKIWPIEGE